MIALILTLLAVVNTTNSSVSYTCDGSTAVYSVNFPYLASTDLVVTSTTTGGSVTTLTPVTDWLVNFASTSSTATLTLTNPAVKCPNTNVLKITRIVTRTQPYSFKAQTTYNQGLHETSYDRIVMQVQQLASPSVDLPLRGTGDSSDHFRFDLSNPNTWIGAQTFNGGVALGSPLPVVSGGTGAATAANNTVFAGPNGGGPLAPTFRALAANDIPNLSTAKTTTGTWIDAFLASAYSGIGSCGANTAVTALTRNSAPTCTQPAFSWLTGTAIAAQIPNLDGAKINTGNLTRPVSLNAGETSFNTDALTFNTGGCGLQWNTPHAGLNLFCAGATAIHIDSGTGGGLSNIFFDDFAASNGLLAVAAGALAVSSAPQSAESSFTGYVPAGVAATTAFSRRFYGLASTLTVSSNYVGVIAGSGAGNYVLKLCSDGSVCSGPNTYLTCTITCANVAGTTTACSVTKSAISISTTLTWNVTTACATTSPAGNATAYATTP